MVRKFVIETAKKLRERDRSIFNYLAREEEARKRMRAVS